jgi:hypothetical protein
VQTIRLLNKVNLMHFPRLTLVWRRRIERRSPAGVVEQWQRKRRRLACARGRATAVEEEEVCTRSRVAAAEEEAGSSDVDDSGGDRWSTERDRDLGSFGMKSETTRDRLLFIGSNLSAAVHEKRCG